MTYLRGIDPPGRSDDDTDRAIDELQERRAMRAIRQEREAASRLYGDRRVKAAPIRPPMDPTDPEGTAA